jgi:hypothetical protein
MFARNITNGSQHVHVNLPVLEGIIQVFGGVLIGQGGSVFLEACPDFLTLFLG